MTAGRVLFVNHASAMSGAEFVLAQVTRAFPGATAFLFDEGPLVQALADNGLRTVVSKHGGGLGAIKRDRSLLHAIPAAAKLARIVGEIAAEARRHQLVYANSQKAFVLAALAVLAVRRPLVWHLHDIIDGEHFGGAQRKLQIGLANRVASRVVVPSTACADAFARAGGRRDLVSVIPNGIAVPPSFTPADRGEIGLPEGPLVGVFSRLARWKGQHVVIEALKQTPGVKAALIGSALFGEDAYEKELHALVRELGLQDRVTFLGQRNDVMRVMTAVDCMVHSSIYAEPFGLTLVEAMTAGTPVIATDAGAAREILADGKAGVLVAPDDASGLAGALRAFFADKAAAAARTAYAAERAGQLYTTSRMQERVSQLVGELAPGAAA